jgi:hypothetical protein
MSTQVEEGIEEGVEGIDDVLIDSLIDVVHFVDLVSEKDVVYVDQIEVFCNFIIRSMQLIKQMGLFLLYSTLQNLKLVDHILYSQL